MVTGMMNRFFAALRFLTIFPVPGKMGLTEKSLATSLPFFPIVGLVLGGLLAGVAQLCGVLFSPLLTAVFVASVMLAVSGGLHVDGLCDMADGFFSSRPRAIILEIMRDSRVGAMGVIAVVLVFAIKTAALATVVPGMWLPALLMPFAGRIVLVLHTAFMPYARSEGGLATLFFQHKQSARRAAWWSLALFVAVCWLLAGSAGLIVVGAVLVISFFFAFFCRNKIGGITGDTLGAACEISETVVAVTLAAKPVLTLWGG